MKSLRRRLMVGTCIGTAGILTLAGALLYGLVRASLVKDFDDRLREKAGTLAAMVEQDGAGISLEFTEAQMDEFRREVRPEYFEVAYADGELIEKSPSLGGNRLPSNFRRTREAVIDVLTLPNGDAGRMVTLTFSPRLDDEVTEPVLPVDLRFALARDTRDMTSSLKRLGGLLILVGVVATVFSLLVLSALVRLGLRPVNRLAGQIASIDERRLSTSLHSHETLIELAPIVARLNEMLDRLALAFQREKALTANIAHELRTPLAGIRTTLEVALSRERDWVASREAMSSCLAICTRTQRMIENLLDMARLDTRAETVNRERVGVEAVMRHAWEPFAAIARNRSLDVEWEFEGKLELWTDRERLGIVLSNVLENAARYTNAGGCVRISCRGADGALHLRFANSGCSLDRRALEHVFEPFWRGDTARAETESHSGLGLALSQKIIDRLGGLVTAELTEDHWFVLTIAIPNSSSLSR